MAKTFQDYCDELAKKFLQTVVVVDDRASYGEDLLEPVLNLNPPGRDNGNVGDVDLAANAETRQQQGLDAKCLIDACANQGLVCAILRPGQGEDPIPTTIQAAVRSDILVLDWDMNGDGGDSAMSIIRRIIEQGGGYRTRLVVIYAGQGDILDIISSIIRNLDDAGLDTGLLDDTGYTLTCGSMRITAFAKAHVLLALPERRVPESELPVRLIKEFSMITTGLLSCVAVAALSAIRDNTHKLLSRISTDLDAPYLAHRAMLPIPDDAKRQAAALVAGEICSILDESEIGRIADIKNILLWLHAQREKGILFDKRFELPPGNNPVEDVCTLLTLGCGSDGLPDHLKKHRKSPHKSNLAGKFCYYIDNGKGLDNTFACLTTTQTRYLRPQPQLSLGQVISRTLGRVKSFWLCIQPMCDSERIVGERAFPLLPLSAVDEDKPFDLVVEVNTGQFIKLKIRNKPYACQMVTFRADPVTETVVAQRHSQGYYYHDAQGQTYKWIAELKSEYALNIVHQYSAEASRIAFDPSEWLRRWSRE